MSLNLTVVVHELHLEQHVSVLKQPFLEADHDELRVLEVLSDHLPDVLGVRQVQGGVNLV